MDRKESKRRLSELLELNNTVPYAADCIRGIRDGGLKSQPGATPIAIAAIRTIYGVRGRRVKSRGLPIYGFGHLLTNLENSCESLVSIYTIETGEFDYWVFTNEKIDVLFGILAFDERTDWRGKWKDLPDEDDNDFDETSPDESP